MINSSNLKSIIIVLIIVNFCVATIKWDITGDSMIYGRDATLTCNITVCPSNAVVTWIGGPNYILLGFDDYSTNPSKYELVSRYTSAEFDLIIKGFNFSDANVEYTCSCGFLQFTNKLTLNNFNFIYFPVVKEHLFTQMNDELQITFSMEVFPLPKCRIFYEASVTAVSLTVKNIPTGIDLELYNVRIRHTLYLRSKECKGNINLICAIQLLELDVHHQKIDKCKGEHVAGIIIGSVALTVTLIMIIAVYIYSKVKARGTCTRHETESENTIVLIKVETTVNKKKDSDND